MNNVIIFKDIEKMALDPSLENLILFGETDFVSNGEEIYDLVFHAKKANPYNTLRATSLIIPVLRLPSDDPDLAIEKVYNEYLKHRQFTRYSVQSSRLTFYEITEKEFGKEITSSEKYKKVERTELFRIAKSTNLPREIMEKIRLIDERYHAAF